jgi:hypothetical protein
MENGKIFISYRREDTSGESGRLKDTLEQIFGKESIFYDGETLEAGLNFDQSIAKALNESNVLLAMIGPHWMKVADSKGVKRLQKPDDWVRKEIAEAIKRNIRVIPVLVNGADMPDPDELPEDLKELSMKHAQELTSSRWNYDVGVLTKVLEKFIMRNPELAPRPTPQPSSPRSFVSPVPEPKKWWTKNYVWAIGGIVGFVILISIFSSGQDEVADSSTENYDQIEDYSSAELSQEEISNLMVNSEWTLTEERNDTLYETIINFYDAEGEILFEEANGDNGTGSVQIDNQSIVLSFSTSDYDPTGKVILETEDAGNTWKGKSSYSQSGTTYNSTLTKH